MKAKKLILAGAVAASLMVSSSIAYAMPSDVNNDGFGYEDDAEDTIGAGAGYNDTGDYEDDYDPDASADTLGYYGDDYDPDASANTAGYYGDDYNPDASANTAGYYYNSDDYLMDIDVMMTATATVNMRTSPNGSIVGCLQKDDDIHVIGNQTDVCWYKCETDDGEIVYICDDYLLPDFPETLTATHMVNVRSGASTSYDIVGVLDIGDTIKASALENGWIKFTYEKTGKAGYVYASYVAVR